MINSNSGTEPHAEDIALAILPAASDPIQCHETVDPPPPGSKNPQQPELKANHLVHGNFQFFATLLSLFVSFLLPRI